MIIGLLLFFGYSLESLSLSLYIITPTKSYHVVSESSISRASDMFHNTGINVVTSYGFWVVVLVMR